LTKNFDAINAAGDCDKWAWHVDISESNRGYHQQGHICMATKVKPGSWKSESPRWSL